MTSGIERRRHVRLKPIAELPARAVLVSSGPLHETLDVLDISVGGMALARPPAGTPKVGDNAKLRLRLGHNDEQLVDVLVRWVSADAFGVELASPTEEVEKSIRTYTSDLLERGLSV